MKRFRFPLQGVLNYRAYLEQLAREETAKAGLAVVESQERLETFSRDLSQSAVQMEKAVARGISAKDFRQHFLHLQGLEADIEYETMNKQVLEKKLFEKRQELTKKLIDKKIMERLYEKQKEKFVEESLLAEQKELDEMSSLKKARESMNENS